MQLKVWLRDEGTFQMLSNQTQRLAIHSKFRGVLDADSPLEVDLVVLTKPFLPRTVASVAWVVTSSEFLVQREALGGKCS